MRRALAALALLAVVAAPILAESVSRDGPFQAPSPVYMPDVLGRGPSLVVVVNEQGVMADLGPMYGNALTNAGFPYDIIYEPMGVWPALDDYDVVLVTFADNWWGYSWLVPQDEDPLEAYMDAGGNVILIGQDYLFFRGGHGGFPSTHLGVCDHVDDVLWADETLLTWDGDGGSPLEGLHGEYYGLECYTPPGANALFTDEVIPCTQGLLTWSTEGYPIPTEGGAVEANGIFSCVDFGCDDAVIDAAIAAIMDYFGGCTAAEQDTWGSIKEMYR